MEKNNLIKLEKKTTAVEKQLIGELYLLENMNDIIAFTQTYISNYLPVLFYSVKHFDKNKIAKLMNSSILIDRLLSIKIDAMVRFQVSTGVREIINANKLTDEKSIARLYNNLTSVNKAHLSSSLLFMFSLMRGALFSLYCDNKMYLNYGIGWNNLLIHFLENPHMIFMLDNKDLNLAEEQLDFIKNDLSKENGELEGEINSALVQGGICNEEDCLNIEKHFLGLKYEWLKSMSLVLYCKFLKTNDETHLKDAIKYSNIILESLESSDTSYHSFSFRTKLTFPGPSADIKNIIGDISQYSKIIKILNYAAYFESDKSRFVLVFPTSLSFYFNNQMVNAKKQSILDDEEFIVLMHKKECFGILEFLKAIQDPSKTDYYESIKRYSSILQEFDKKGLSNKFIYSQLRNSQIKDKIISTFDKRINKSRTVSNVLGITVISLFNHFAEARGFPQIPAYINTTVPLVTEIIMSTIYKSGYEKLILDLSAEDDDSNFLGFDDEDEFESIVKLEEQIECLEESSNDLLNYINLDGLKNILYVNNEVMNLIKSSMSIPTLSH